MKNKFIAKGKRGVVGSALSNFWSYIIFIFIILIFIVLFRFQGDAIQNKIVSSDDGINPDIVLLNYLRTPVMDNGQEKIFADIIVGSLIELALSKSGDLNLFQNKITKIFDDNFPRTHIHQRFMIITDNGVICWYDSLGKACQFRQDLIYKIPESIVLLPVPGQNFKVIDKNIEVVLQQRNVLP